jgi:hypothetical protein
VYFDGKKVNADALGGGGGILDLFDNPIGCLSSFTAEVVRNLEVSEQLY